MPENGGGKSATVTKINSSRNNNSGLSQAETGTVQNFTKGNSDNLHSYTYKTTQVDRQKNAYTTHQDQHQRQYTHRVADLNSSQRDSVSKKHTISHTHNSNNQSTARIIADTNTTRTKNVYDYNSRPHSNIQPQLTHQSHNTVSNGYKTHEQTITSSKISDGKVIEKITNVTTRFQTGLF